MGGDLLEANVGGPLAEALTADHQVVLADETLVAIADAAASRVCRGSETANQRWTVPRILPPIQAKLPGGVFGPPLTRTPPHEAIHPALRPLRGDRTEASDRRLNPLRL